MALNAKNKKSSGGGKDFVEQEVVEEGTYPCRIAQVIELGLQPQRPWKGDAKPPVDMLYITYELTDTFMLDEKGEEIEDKPRWMSEDFPYYSLDCDMAKCNKRLRAIDPTNKVDGDWALIGGAPCNVTFVHNESGGKTYANVASVAAVRAKDAKAMPKLQNPVKIFDLDEPDMEIFEALPKWLQDKIKANLNFKGSPLEEALGGVQEEENEGEEKVEEKKAPPKKKATPKEEVEEKYENDADDGDEPW